MAQTEERPGLLRAGEVRKLLGIRDTTLKKMRQQGDVEVVRLPTGGMRYTDASVQAIIQGQVSHDA